MQDFGCEIHVHDPLADPEEALYEYGITLRKWDQLPKKADTIIAAVSHSEYLSQPVANLLAFKKFGVFIDIKSAYIPEDITAKGGACGDYRLNILSINNLNSNNLKTRYLSH